VLGLTDRGEGGVDARILPPSFYARRAVTVARDLLGCLLISRVEGELTGGIIVETEAYAGATDGASHAFRYHRSPRVESMYGDPGTAYVYLIYGIHNCLNAVCLRRGEPHAVLIRAILPGVGIPVMRRRRGAAKGRGESFRGLADGPGKLCRALGIDRSLDGAPLTDPRGTLRVLRGIGLPGYKRRRRVGIESRGGFAALPWRFVADEPPPRTFRGLSGKLLADPPPQ